MYLDYLFIIRDIARTYCELSGRLGDARMMASRQRPAATVEDAQRVLEDEEPVSDLAEGDEIMEEAEEQEDGYSEPFLLVLNTLFAFCTPFGLTEYTLKGW